MDFAIHQYKPFSGGAKNCTHIVHFGSNDANNWRPHACPIRSRNVTGKGKKVGTVSRRIDTGTGENWWREGLEGRILAVVVHMEFLIPFPQTDISL